MNVKSILSAGDNRGFEYAGVLVISSAVRPSGRVRRESAWCEHTVGRATNTANRVKDTRHIVVALKHAMLVGCMTVNVPEHGNPNQRFRLA